MSSASSARFAITSIGREDALRAAEGELWALLDAAESPQFTLARGSG
jgi:hypothetical protein